MSRKAVRPRLLVVDDDDTFRQVLSSELTRRGFAVESVGTGRGALEAAAAGDPEVILLDMRLPDLDGIEVLAALRERDLARGVIILTGHGTIDTAIQAIRLGAYDYLEKPCPIDKVEMTIAKTREHLGLLARQRVLQDGYTPPDVRPGMIGAGPAFTRLIETIAKIGPAEVTTLILGETGVGKEMVAKLLHTQSGRREAPYVVLDCGALHENLLQSELFGHEKGAFSGAARRKHGLFEVADGGTLFLDEVGELSLDTQATLLRVLETGTFRHLGGTDEIRVDVRVVSATNRDLEAAVAARRFREDLFFRLSTLTVEVPPLRERREDIPLLTEHFVARFNQRFRCESRLSDEARALLAAYAWPGNVRELIHVIEQSIVMHADEVIGPDGLPPLIRAEEGAVAPVELLPLRELERRHVRSVLDAVGGNRGRAAGVLGISERNLYRMIRRYGWSEADGEASRPHA